MGTEAPRSWSVRTETKPGWSGGSPELEAAFRLFDADANNATAVQAEIITYFQQADPMEFIRAGQCLFAYLVVTNLRERPEAQDFVLAIYHGIGELLVVQLQSPAYWHKHPLGVDTILDLITSLQQIESHQAWLRAGELAKKAIPSLIDHISTHNLDYTFTIHQVITNYLRHRSDPNVNEALLTRLRRNTDPAEYLIFLHSADPQIESTLRQWFLLYLQSELALTLPESEETLDRWLRSSPKQAPVTLTNNYQALQDLEAALPGAAAFLIQRKLVYCFARYPLSVLVEQVKKLRDRGEKGWSNQEVKKAPRTVNFLVVKPHDDHSGKMYDGKDMLELLHTKMHQVEARNHGKVTCNLLVMEYGQPIDMLHTLENWVQHFGLFAGLVEHSHGGDTILYLEKPYDQVTVESIKKMLKGIALRPQSSFLARFMACFQSQPKFVLDSCYVGRGPDSLAANLSQTGAEVFASDNETTSICLNFGFNQTMRLQPYFLGGRNLHFHLGAGQEYEAPITELTRGMNKRSKEMLRRHGFNI